MINQCNVLCCKNLNLRNYPCDLLREVGSHIFASVCLCSCMSVCSWYMATILHRSISNFTVTCNLADGVVAGWVFPPPGKKCRNSPKDIWSKAKLVRRPGISDVSPCLEFQGCQFDRTFLYLLFCFFCLVLLRFLTSFLGGGRGNMQLFTILPHWTSHGKDWQSVQLQNFNRTGLGIWVLKKSLLGSLWEYIVYLKAPKQEIWYISWEQSTNYWRLKKYTHWTQKCPFSRLKNVFSNTDSDIKSYTF